MELDRHKYVDKIINMLKSLNETTSEMEVSLCHSNKLLKTNYLALANYLVTRAKRDNAPSNNLYVTHSLDIAYRYDSSKRNIYRIMINGTDSINKLMAKLSIRNNSNVFSILVNNYSESNDDIVQIQHKTKDDDDMIDVFEYDMRFRLAKELPLTNTEIEQLRLLNESEKNKITYRLKYRLTYVVPIDTHTSLHIDLTDVKMSESINKLGTPLKSNYELEIEVVTNNPANPKQIYDKLMYEIYNLYNMLQGSNVIISTTERESVLNEFKRLLYGSDRAYIHKVDLPIMNAESLGNLHAPILSTNYSVTDKADGERAFLIILSGKAYIINNNMMMKRVSIDPVVNEYNDTIIDGEYVFVKKYNKYMFLGFDILCAAGVDTRPEVKLVKRLDKMHEIINACFPSATMLSNQSVKKQKSTKSKLPIAAVGGAAKTGLSVAGGAAVSTNNITTIMENTVIKMKEYLINMKERLEKDEVVIMSKMFYMPSGLFNSEIFMYSKLMWEMYKHAPYVLDGMIYTGLNQVYTTDVTKTEFKILKWKPPHMNTIDFYVKFKRGGFDNKILNVFDNAIAEKSLDDKLENMTDDDVMNDIQMADEFDEYEATDGIYRIAELHVSTLR